MGSRFNRSRKCAQQFADPSITRMCFAAGPTTYSCEVARNTQSISSCIVRQSILASVSISGRGPLEKLTLPQRGPHGTSSTCSRRGTPSLRRARTSTPTRSSLSWIIAWPREATSRSPRGSSTIPSTAVRGPISTMTGSSVLRRAPSNVLGFGRFWERVGGWTRFTGPPITSAIPSRPLSREDRCGSERRAAFRMRSPRTASDMR